jgi:hypothetical protein
MLDLVGSAGVPVSVVEVLGDCAERDPLRSGTVTGCVTGATVSVEGGEHSLDRALPNSPATLPVS